jgi:Tol biopolymer transport system component
VAEAPSWSPDGSRIVFQHYTLGVGTGRDLSVIRVDGTGLRRITRALREDIQPAWSPDGSRIAFASNRGPGRRFGDWEIHVVRPDGRGVRALTNNGFVDREPAWSPDGSLVAFQSGRAEGRLNPELWTMRSDGSEQRRVQPAAGPSGFPVWSEQSPSWSPDGNWLVYVSNESNYPDNIVIVRPDGRDKTDLTPATPSFDLQPAWQPVCSHPGTPRPDVLRGTFVDDRLCGFAGSDSIRGGSGRDGLYGGDGNDTLSARDGSFDVVGCGSGRDEVVADRVDLVGVDCERIRRS